MLKTNKLSVPTVGNYYNRQKKKTKEHKRDLLTSARVLLEKSKNPTNEKEEARLINTPLCGTRVYIINIWLTKPRRIVSGSSSSSSSRQMVKRRYNTKAGAGQYHGVYYESNFPHPWAQPRDYYNTLLSRYSSSIVIQFFIADRWVNKKKKPNRQASSI